jgi:hypothetical protein
MKHKISICRFIFVIGIALGLGYLSMTICKLIQADVRSLFMTFGLWFFLMLGVWGIDFFHFIIPSLICLFCVPETPDKQFAKIASFGRRSIIGIAILVTLFNLFELAQNIPSPETFIHVIAGAFLPILCALIISEIFLVIVYHSNNEFPEE